MTRRMEWLRDFYAQCPLTCTFLAIAAVVLLFMILSGVPWSTP